MIIMLPDYISALRFSLRELSARRVLWFLITQLLKYTVDYLWVCLPNLLRGNFNANGECSAVGQKMGDIFWQTISPKKKSPIIGYESYIEHFRLRTIYSTRPR